MRTSLTEAETLKFAIPDKNTAFAVNVTSTKETSASSWSLRFEAVLGER